jgi:hypothetical protein
MSRSLIEKKGKLLQKINSHTRGEFEELLLNHNICFSCAENGDFSLFERRKGELTCLVCGYVPAQNLYAFNLPFGYTGAPGNKLGLGHGLGMTLGEKGMFCVLAHSSGFEDDKRNMPMHASWLRIMTHRYEHPRIAALLMYGRTLCHEYGYDPLRHEWTGAGLDEHQHQKALVFSNYFGDVLRRVGSVLVVQNLRFNARKVTEACFVYAMDKLRGVKEAVELTEKLNVEERFLNMVRILCEVQQK